MVASDSCPRNRRRLATRLRHGKSERDGVAGGRLGAGEPRAASREEEEGGGRSDRRPSEVRTRESGLGRCCAVRRITNGSRCGLRTGKETGDGASRGTGTTGTAGLARVGRLWAEGELLGCFDLFSKICF